MVNNEVECDNTDENEIAPSDESEVFFPLIPKNTSYCPLNVLIGLCAMEDIDAAGDVADDG